jgi:hypothetical protein
MRRRDPCKRILDNLVDPQSTLQGVEALGQPSLATRFRRLQAGDAERWLWRISRSSGRNEFGSDDGLKRRDAGPPDDALGRTRSLVDARAGRGARGRGRASTDRIVDGRGWAPSTRTRGCWYVEVVRLENAVLKSGRDSLLMNYRRASVFNGSSCCRKRRMALAFSKGFSNVSLILRRKRRTHF